MERVTIKSNRSQVTKLINSAKDLILKKENVNELRVIRDRLLNASENLELANKRIVSVLEVNELEAQCEKMLEYQDNVSEMLSRLQIEIEQQTTIPADGQTNVKTDVTSQVLQQSQGKSNVKLPKLELRKFYGEISEWTIFWEQFKTAVHENESIAPSAKYNYLDQCLRGKARNTISGFTPSERSYHDAIDLLKNEYGNEQRIIDYHVQKLLTVNPVKSKLDAIGLRNLYNAISSVSRSLTSSGVNEMEYGMMIKSVLLNSIPYTMKIDYYKTHPMDSQNSLNIAEQINILLNYLKLEVESIEIAQPATMFNESQVTKRSNRHYQNNNWKTKHNTANIKEFTASGLLTTINECLFCKSKDHITEKCRKSNITIKQKKDILQNNRCCFRCTKQNHNAKYCKNRVTCENCNYRHVTSMCDPDYKGKETKVNTTSLFTKNHGNNEQVFLQTAKAYVCEPDQKNTAFIRLVIDGGSQLTYIKEEVSRKLKLKILGTRKLSVMPFGSEERKLPKVYNKVEVNLLSQYNNERITMVAVEVPEICYDAFQTPNINHPVINTLEMADISMGNVSTLNGIVILIGADNYWKIATGEFIRISESLTAINTKLGWTLQGPDINNSTNANTNIVSTLNVQVSDERNEPDMKQFWELETIGINDKDTQRDFTNEFIKNKITITDNRYEVSLPWRNDCQLDSNFKNALARMKHLTFKLSKNANLIEYDKAVRELLDNGIAEEVPRECVPVKSYYMPHQGVYRDDKPLRIVFDASDHSPNVPSLNELLHAGENLIKDLMNILLNFRVGKIAIIADIEKAFLQIKLCEPDRDCHRFLWYKHPIIDISSLPPMQEYRMTRVTFGVTSSPFLLSATLKKLIYEESKQYPETAYQLSNSFYVDDLILTTNSLKKAVKIYEESKHILGKAGMNLRKWHTNNNEFKSYINKNEKVNNELTCPKVLGIYWDTRSDYLYLDLTSIIAFVDKSQVYTKRHVCQSLGRIYDPLSILGPFTIKAKIFLQLIWKLKIDWDDELPTEYKSTWIQWCNDLSKLNSYMIPRNVVSNINSKFELHIFCDSSQNAYGTVAYIREIYEDNVSVKFLIAKNRVTPIKKSDSNDLTLPKLELTAALCASRLKDYIVKNINIKFESVNLWSDSKITLYWVAGDVSKWKMYIKNRVLEIQKLTKDSVWRHCAGKLNPADLLTRGLRASEFLKIDFWLNGPEFLSSLENEWFNDDNLTSHNLSNDKTLCFINVTSENKNDIITEPIFSLGNYEQLEKCLRVTAYIKRVFRKDNKVLLNLTAEELKEAEMYWIKIDQNVFNQEIEDLKKNGTVNKKSSIYKLTPFLDEKGLLRLKSRLQESDLPYETANPIVLTKNSLFAEKLIWKIHNSCFHSGTNLTLAEIRKRFWIIRGRQRIKSILSKCIICKKLRGKPGQESFAPLPKERILLSSAFDKTGVDFAGPLYVLNESNKEQKSYLMLLTCAVTRAVHLELVLDLTTESCIRGLRRFIARRGVPSTFYSDNAKTFKRTSLELTKLYETLTNEEILNLSTNKRITWKFIVERAAWWGGFWERMIKTVKDCLKFALGKTLVNIEELRTILTEIEATVNSRPLTYIDDDINNLSVLSPSNFLLGNQQKTTLPNPNEHLKRDMILQMWKERKRILLKFWKKWSTDYLQQLRTAHQNTGSSVKGVMKINDIVLLHDQGAPRLSWKMARINQIYPGRDGKIRACEIQLANKTLLRRPIQLLYPLEIPNPAREDVENTGTSN